jgi:D-alanyl-D-alanine carboxypeptidase/D-alanyl-D-alanine-endopeptidase (penicillin-binding protein 4)
MVPPASEVKVENGVVTREGDGGPFKANIDRARDANVFTLSGACTRPTELESKSVTDPAAFFADALRTHLASRGITIDGKIRRAEKPLDGSPVPPAEKILATYETKMLDIMWRINKSSQNMFAEAMCKAVGRQHRLDNGVDEPGSWQNGSEAVHSFLRNHGIDTSKFVVADGSGLSRENRVTSRLISDLLVLMHTHRDGPAFLASLAAAGVDGTIGSRMKDLTGRVFAKTGYIGGVRSLSGYIKTRENKWLVFSIIYNGIDGSVKPYEALQDEAVRTLVEWPNVPASILQ